MYLYSIKHSMTSVACPIGYLNAVLKHKYVYPEISLKVPVRRTVNLFQVHLSVNILQRISKM